MKPRPGYTILPHGMRFDSTLSYDDWLAISSELMQMGLSLSFQIGDLLNFGQAKFGEKYKEGVKHFPIKYQTLANYAYIAKNVSQSLREPRLGHEHHAVVAPLAPSEQKRWLELAVKHHFSVRRLRLSVKWGRIATVAEAKGNPADRRHVTYLAMIDDLARWWRKENQKLPAAEWDTDRRRSLKKDFDRLQEIFKALD